MNDLKAYYDLTKKAFDFLAPIYNLMTLPLFRVRNQVVDVANVGNGSKILDVATGTGQQAFAFANHGYSVIGVDITESMLEIARKHNRQNLVKFQLCDATQLPFEENTFDVTCISFALHDMPPLIRQKVLVEMARVIKPNGVIIIVDYDLPNNRFARTFIYRLITVYEGEYYKQFISSDLEALLQDTNIQKIGTHSVLLGVARIVKGVKAIAA
jgi:demethylmenaquinone methyltransferase/2-methoxy-6-polyprenyl-1,4-benzoquinol methylase